MSHIALLRYENLSTKTRIREYQAMIVVRNNENIMLIVKKINIEINRLAGRNLQNCRDDLGDGSCIQKMLRI